MGIDFKKGGGIVPVIAQDFRTGEILMLAYTNEEAFNETLKCGEAVYFSRSRQKLWHKGESSGNIQKIRQILLDCDGDTLIYKVEQIGPGACHTGHRSCFFTALENGKEKELYPPSFDPAEVYGKK